MTKNRIKSLISPKGFSLVDLLIGICIGSIILIGAYKVLITNITTTSGAIDLATLDNKTRKTIDVLHRDIADVNGNIINGMPTVFPTFREGDNEIHGFILIKAKKQVPILNLKNAFNPEFATTSIVDLTTSALPQINISAIQPGMAAILYNFGSYAWIPYIIDLVEPITGEENSIKLTIKSLNTEYGEEQWIEYLKTGNCVEYNSAVDNANPSTLVCDSNKSYQKVNTVFIIADIIKYYLDGDKIYRSVNENSSSISIVSTDVTKFNPTFMLKKSTLYTDPSKYPENYKFPFMITNENDMVTYIDNQIPKNNFGYWGLPTNPDDCLALFGYYCKSSTTDDANLINSAYGYISSQIIGINTELEIKTSARKSALSFLLLIDENHGNSGFEAFKPTRIAATRMFSDRNYGSMIANPSIYNDPMGGSVGDYGASSAPMVSPVDHYLDEASSEELTAHCWSPACMANPSSCHPLCTSDLDNDGNQDHLDCWLSGTPGENPPTFCMVPQGSLNDRGLANGLWIGGEGINTDLDSYLIQPKIVFLNPDASLLDSLTYGLDYNSLNYNCSEDNCPLSSYYNLFGFYNFNTYLAGITHQMQYPKADTPFPMTVFPLFENGVLERLYIGAARLRMPDTSSGTTNNYIPKYYSVVFGIDPENMNNTKIISEAMKSSGRSEEDLASVSSLQIRDEGNSQYMYLASHEYGGVYYRKRGKGSLNDEAWSSIAQAFSDSEQQYVKFSWQTRKDPANPLNTKDFLLYPQKDTISDYLGSYSNYEKSRIGSMLAHSDGRIYYCTLPMRPDELYDSDDYFYNKAIVTYTRPIITDENGSEQQCYPSGGFCSRPAQTPKPIDWALCLADSVNCLADYPVADYVYPSYSGRLKVAFKKADNSWEIKTIANLHDGCTGLAEDKITGDILMGGATNIATISYEDLNHNLVDNTTSNVDLGYKRSDNNLYSANNELPALLDPESTKNIKTAVSEQGIHDNQHLFEFRRLSGFNILPNSSKLILSFTDMVMRELGFIVQQRNPYRKQLFAQIIYDDATMDRNYDKVAIWRKGEVDMEEKFSSWLLPFNSTSSWADGTNLDENGNAKYPIAGPINVRPPSDITNFTPTGTTYNRNLDADTTGNTCYIYPGETKPCGQDEFWRACAGDVLSQVSMGLMGRQTGRGCGLDVSAIDDPFIWPSSGDDGGCKGGGVDESCSPPASE